TCAITVSISPGAINKLTSATITSVAQDVLNTCPTLAGSPGGWGLYGTLDGHNRRSLPIHTCSHLADRSIIADTFLAVTSTTSPTPPPSASLTPGQGELQFHPQAYFLRSFWYGGETGGVNITDLPGYNETIRRTFPPETYAPYTSEEMAFCGLSSWGKTCQSDDECCENASCMNRLSADSQSVLRVCVPAGEVVKPATVTTEGDTVVIRPNHGRRMKRRNGAEKYSVISRIKQGNVGV
ncbi:MAG: hypothetical protein Q9183_007428, partial [Haloplaca sp. 2 TL-2023]